MSPQLKVEDVSLLSAEEQAVDDDISEPDEDTFEGQMALMKGGSVKKIPDHDSSDDDSETDSDDSSSSSDSDSDSD